VRPIPSAAALALLCALPASARAAPPARPDAPLSVADFARHARLVDARLSPRGTRLATVVAEGRRLSLVVTDLEKRQTLSIPRPYGDSMVGSVHWVDDDRLVAGLVAEEPGLSEPVSRGELWAVNADGGGARTIFGYRAGDPETASRVRRPEPLREWATFLARIAGDRRGFLAETRPWDEAGDRGSSVWRIDATTGARERMTTTPFLAATYLVDEHGAVRVAAAPTPDRALRVALLAPDGSWRDLDRLPGLSEFYPVGVGADDGVLYVAGRSAGTYGLFAVPLAGGEPRLLAGNPLVPPSGFVADRATHRIVAVEFEPDLPRWELVLPAHPLARLLAGLLAANPGSHVRLLDTSDDQRRAIVKVYSDRDPGRLLVVDVATLAATPVGEARPWLRPEALSPMRPFHLDASDGFRLHGYVTSPRRATGAGPPPLVVLVHGGPHGVRDTWGYDPEVQLLASQGFAVLQVNFRGSGGYGGEYQEAGYRRWGDRVVDDVVDATRWALAQGLGDPGRVCVVGSSFGGYAALQAAVRAPDLFRCVAGYGGVYDLTRAGSAEQFRMSRILRGYDRIAMGDDEAALRGVSPADHAARIRARVLLAHGARDPIVPVEQTERMRDALEKAGNAPEAWIEPREGHALYEEAARERYYGRLVAFLRRSTAPLAPSPSRSDRASLDPVSVATR
jgi:dipeptidyl aminopeptidase/acylaminoacyl peptidase